MLCSNQRICLHILIQGRRKKLQNGTEHLMLIYSSKTQTVYRRVSTSDNQRKEDTILKFVLRPEKILILVKLVFLLANGFTTTVLSNDRKLAHSNDELMV